MTWPLARTWIVRTLSAAAAAVAPACSPPLTDITATNTERVGRYEVRGHVVDNDYRATVCVDPGGDREEISVRIVQQLLNHHFRTVTLEMFTASSGTSADVMRVTWTPQTGSQTTGPERVAENPCRREAAESAH
jgi:hypothetical protein